MKTRNALIVMLALTTLISCGESDRETKNPQDSAVSSSPKGPTGSPTDTTETTMSDKEDQSSDETTASDKNSFPENIDEFGNRTDVGAYSSDPCQETPPGKGCNKNE